MTIHRKISTKTCWCAWNWPSGVAPDRQRQLAEQVKAVLRTLNFREAIAYDHHGYGHLPFTRLVGTIPSGRLEVLLKDLRGQPGGWFAALIPPQDVPAPLRNVNPIQIVEVMAESEPIAEIALPGPRTPDYLEKISAELWSQLEAKQPGDEALRVELIFARMLNADDRSWRGLLEEAAPGVFVESQLGQVVNAVVTRGQVKTLAALDSIVTIRLPRAVRIDIDPGVSLPGDNARALALSGLEALHKKGKLGQGVRLALLDTDFRGWSELVSKGKLPANTRLVDLTAERDTELHPGPSTAPGPVGHGTQCALAAALAAPKAELVLVRVDRSSAYQIAEVARYVRDGNLSSPYVDRRRDELVTARAELNLLRSDVLRERRLILDNFVDETDQDRDFSFLGPVYGWVFSARTWSRAQLAYLDKLEKTLAERNARFFKLVDDIRSLQGITLIACPLVWNDGFALGAGSPLSRALEGIQRGRAAGQSKWRPGADPVASIGRQHAGAVLVRTV